MSYYYEVDAVKRGKERFFASVVILVITINFQIFIFNREDFPIFLTLVVWGIVSFVIVLLVGQGKKLLKTVGKWKILINEQGISWETPNESLDTSFNLKLNEIEKLEIKSGSYRTHSKISYDYYIHSKSGLVFKLNEISGIKGTRVISELAKVTGISCEYTTR